MHLDALRSYFRWDNMPRELLVLHDLVFGARLMKFTDRLPGTWAGIYGSMLGDDLRLPSLDCAVAVEDETSCVILWSPRPDIPGVSSVIGYVQAQRMPHNPPSYLVLGTPEEQREVEKLLTLTSHALMIDWGTIIGTTHQPQLGPLGYSGMVNPLVNYLVDPDMGAMYGGRRNPEMLNDVFAADRDWIPYDEGEPPYFDQRYCADLQRNIVHALHQYAVITRKAR